MNTRQKGFVLYKLATAQPPVQTASANTPTATPKPITPTAAQAAAPKPATAPAPREWEAGYKDPNNKPQPKPESGWWSVADIAVPILGGVLAPFTGGASLAAAAAYSGGRAAYQVGKGNYSGAAFNALGAIPGLGTAAKTLQLGRTGLTASRAAAAARGGSRFLSAAKNTQAAADAARAIPQATNAFGRGVNAVSQLNNPNVAKWTGRAGMGLMGYDMGKPDAAYSTEQVQDYQQQALAPSSYPYQPWDTYNQLR